jgi:uncharacterized heparinase superfamily protein
MSLYHKERIKHRERLIRIFAGKPGRESIVRDALRALAESLEAIGPDDAEDF